MKKKMGETVSMRYANTLLAATIAANGLAFALTSAAQAAPTTPERLLNAANEPQNWLMYLGTYNGWHYSKLGQINRSNVSGLHVAYMASIGGAAVRTIPSASGNEMASPLVEDGIIYVTDSHNRLMAFDARSGTGAVPLWRFDPQSEKVYTSRGVALYNNSVIQATNDGRIVAVDKSSGEEQWEVSGKEKSGAGPNADEFIATQSFAAVPTVFPTDGGKAIVAIGPGYPSAGVGWYAGFDADNGDLVWRTYTIPQPGEPNFGTWPGDKWKYGGVMTWGVPSFDPETNTILMGTGEPSPVYDPEFRPGDNLYSVSTLALDVNTGKIKWYFQETPNDQNDYDSTASRILFDFKSADGTVHHATSNWARNGFFYTIDRDSGQFLQAVPEVDNINWTAGIDPKTGKPVEYTPGAGVQTYAVAGPRRGRPESDAPKICATWGGAPTGIWPASYDPTSGITYNTRTTGCTYQTILKTTDEAFNPLSRENLGSAIKQVQVNTMAAVVAIDTAAGKVVNTYTRDLGIPGDRQAEVGALATAGGLVFAGFDDGSISAYDKDTLVELWRFNTGTSLKGPIISFAMGGKQYIAHIAGGDNPGSSGLNALRQPSAMLVVYGL
jgi:alcohol dehydrogenase (cytochrome c)